MKYILAMGDFWNGMPRRYSTAKTLKEAHETLTKMGFRRKRRHRFGEAAYYEDQTSKRWVRVLRSQPLDQEVS